jgi:hypothetical protein
MDIVLHALQPNKSTDHSSKLGLSQSLGTGTRVLIESIPKSISRLGRRPQSTLSKMRGARE